MSVVGQDISARSPKETHLIRTRMAKSATARRYWAQLPSRRKKKKWARTRRRFRRIDCGGVSGWVSVPAPEEKASERRTWYAWKRT